LSYSFLNEDALLDRVFAGIVGRYVDVGASMPVEGSNTYALYLRGWSGIVVDPLFSIDPDVASMWRTDRPRDLIVKAAASDHDGQIDFYLCSHRSLSTGSQRIVDYWRSAPMAQIGVLRLRCRVGRSTRCCAAIRCRKYTS
jgi:hypothetical protein